MLRRMKFYIDHFGLSGLTCVLGAKFSGTTGFIEVRRPDCRFSFRLRAPSSDIPTYMQVFSDQQYAFETATPPEVIVDAGANVGLSAIYFANRYPDARIIALEPEQENFQLLEQNAKPYPKITPIKAALWHRNEEINLIDPGRGSWGFMTESNATADVPGAMPGEILSPVQGVTLDFVMQKYGLDRVDVFKCDIEGAEREVFAASDTWIDRIDSVIVELHNDNKPGCSRVFFNNTPGFDTEWERGENIFLSRNGRIRCPAAV